MYASRPVVAVASGGPLESVIDGKTGFLAAGNATSFADALEKLVTSADLSENMGAAGRKHVAAHFSLKAFGDDLDAAVRELAEMPGAGVAVYFVLAAVALCAETMASFLSSYLCF